MIVAENTQLFLFIFDTFGESVEVCICLRRNNNLKQLRGNTLLNAKIEQLQLLAVAEMCAQLFSPTVTGGKGKEKRKGEESQTHLVHIRIRKETSNSNCDKSNKV